MLAHSKNDKQSKTLNEMNDLVIPDDQAEAA